MLPKLLWNGPVSPATKRSAVRSREADDHVRDCLGTPAGPRLWRGGIPEMGNLIGDVLDATGQNLDQSSRTEHGPGAGSRVV